ncbi:unnamed protein product [Acanthoscelides obtectus]|uniref:C2H2-type domain-containing protein n=1 Tax=Acanthoscelides obtectus TaxID=200917 RepID=A0A9P0K0L7_ACAOB|nr:unnamed protein product [Acanthoscelides obtectus]CAK1669734.1 hypothetical protein AOBTE_LOCUS27212 [Acanthoscelides obtectus]
MIEHPNNDKNSYIHCGSGLKQSLEILEGTSLWKNTAILSRNKPRRKVHFLKKKLFHCNCGKVYMKKNTFNRHVRYECGRPDPSFSCIHCHYKCWRKDKIVTHYKTKHLIHCRDTIQKLLNES